MSEQNSERSPAFKAMKKRLEEKAREAKRRSVSIKFHDIKKAVVMGSNLISINGTFYEASTTGWQNGEIIYVTNTGKPSAAFYEPLEKQDEAAKRYLWQTLEINPRETLIEMLSIFLSVGEDASGLMVAGIPSMSKPFSIELPGWGRVDFLKPILPEKVKPGTKPLSPEEYAEFVHEIIDGPKGWRKWRNKGYSQNEFCSNRGWESRRILTKAIAWYREKFGPNSI